MVGRVLVPAELAQPCNDPRQLAPVGHDDGQVVQAGCLWLDGPLGARMEHDDLAAGGPHADLGAVGRHRLQAYVVAVKAERTLAVRDGDLDRSHAGLRGDRLSLHSTFLPRRRAGYSRWGKGTLG